MFRKIFGAHTHIVLHYPLILIVEDEANDVSLLIRALQRAGITNPLRVLSNGREAVAYLTGEGIYSARDEHPVPGLVLLDLKLPFMDGFSVLKWIRQQPRFKKLCVIVLTPSTEILDCTQACSLGANSFLVKPLDFENVAALKATLKAQGILPAEPQPLAA